MQAVTEKMREPETVTAAYDFKIDYGAAARCFKQSPTEIGDTGDRPKREARTRK